MAITNTIDLRDQSVGKESRPVRHQYTEDELNALREQFATVALALDDEAEAFKLVREEFKARIKPKEQERRELAGQVRHRYRDETIECYLVPDFDSGMMEFIAIATGEKVDERRLRPDERQMNIHAAIHTV